MKTIACSKIDIKILLKCAKLFKVEKNERLAPLLLTLNIFTGTVSPRWSLLSLKLKMETPEQSVESVHSQQ